MSGKRPASASYEENWRRRLAEAEQRYRLAVRELTALKESPNSAPDQVDLATKRKAAAREEYRRVLRTFTDLIVRGIPPGDSGSGPELALSHPPDNHQTR